MIRRTSGLPDRSPSRRSEAGVQPFHNDWIERMSNRAARAADFRRKQRDKRRQRRERTADH